MVWLKVNEKAKEIFYSGIFELYVLNENNTESLIETFEDLEFNLAYGLDIAIEVGKILCSECGNDNCEHEHYILCDVCYSNVLDEVYAKGANGI